MSNKHLMKYLGVSIWIIALLLMGFDYYGLLIPIAIFPFALFAAKKKFEHEQKHKWHEQNDLFNLKMKEKMKMSDKEFEEYEKYRKDDWNEALKHNGANPLKWKK